MMRVRFLKDFEIPEVFSRKNCVLCKVLGLRSYKASDKPVLVSTEHGKAARAAGAAVEVQMQQAATKGELSGDELAALREALA